MITKDLALLFERDLLKLKVEIVAYPDETKMWLTVPGISNSGGNLCLHLLGNLGHFIGAVLGGSGYIRNRPEEFSRKNVPVRELTDTIDATIVIVIQTLRSLDTATLEKEYPEKVFDFTMTTHYFMLHLLAHLDYHLGQINYHRRLLGA